MQTLPLSFTETLVYINYTICLEIDSGKTSKIKVSGKETITALPF